MILIKSPKMATAQQSNKKVEKKLTPLIVGPTESAELINKNNILIITIQDYTQVPACDIQCIYECVTCIMGDNPNIEISKNDNLYLVWIADNPVYDIACSLNCLVEEDALAETAKDSEVTEILFKESEDDSDLVEIPDYIVSDLCTTDYIPNTYYRMQRLLGEMNKDWVRYDFVPFEEDGFRTRQLYVWNLKCRLNSSHHPLKHEDDAEFCGTFSVTTTVDDDTE